MTGEREESECQVRISTTKRMTVVGATNLTAGQMMTFLEDVPDDAGITVRTGEPSRPGERPTVTVEVTFQ